MGSNLPFFSSELLMKTKFKTNILLSVLLTSMAMPIDVLAESVSNLTIDIDGLQNDRGQICLSVFADGKGFPSDGKNAIDRQCVPVIHSSVSVTFKNLQPGNYAVAVLHDANQDNKINTNFFGIPTEGFGFSQNPTISIGTPKFADSAFIVQGSDTKIKIKLQYF